MPTDQTNLATTGVCPGKMFPLQQDGDWPNKTLHAKIPWNFVSQFAAQIIANHDQTLERLAQRGGLSPRELLTAIEGKSLRCFTDATAQEAWMLIHRLVSEHQARIDAAKQEQRHNDYQDEIYLKSLNDLDAAKEKEKRNE